MAIDNLELVYVIRYHSNGRVYSETFYNEEGNYHHPTRPAKTEYYDNGNEMYQHYYVHGVHHRDNNEPAYYSWRKNGGCDQVAYYKNGKLHNTIGPGYIRYGENGALIHSEYYLNDVKLTEAEWKKKIKYPKIGEIVELDGVKYRLSPIE